MFDFLFGTKTNSVPLRKEFSTIITRLSNDGQAVIFKENSKSVSWGVANMGGKVIFSIKLIDDNTIATSWLSESPFFGVHSESWEFPREMNQDRIVDEMNYGIQRVLRNGL